MGIQKFVNDYILEMGRRRNFKLDTFPIVIIILIFGILSLHNVSY